MTNGAVVVLGACGRNFAAGMSGGLAYVFDERNDFTQKRCNTASVDLDPLEAEDEEFLRRLISKHMVLTGSSRARWILQHWADTLPRFVKVFPHEYKRVLQKNKPEPSLIVHQEAPFAAEVQHG